MFWGKVPRLLPIAYTLLSCFAKFNALQNNTAPHRYCLFLLRGNLVRLSPQGALIFYCLAFSPWCIFLIWFTWYCASYRAASILFLNLLGKVHDDCPFSKAKGLHHSFSFFLIQWSQSSAPCMEILSIIVSYRMKTFKGKRTELFLYQLYEINTIS